MDPLDSLTTYPWRRGEMRNTTYRIALGALVAAGLLPAQTATPKLEFEVATIKPAAPPNPQMILAGKVHLGMTIDGGRVDFGFLSLADLIPIAYRVKPYQVSGPDGLAQTRFDIQAKIPDGASKDNVPDMLQSLLADRFKLAMHRENREHAVYALVVAKGGLKMKPAVEEPEAPKAADGAPKGIAIGGLDGSQSRVTQDSKGVVIRGGNTGTMRMTPGPEGMHLEANGMTMSAFVDTISRLVDRPVVDMTELKGGYQIAMDLSLADLMQAARALGVGAGAPIPAAAAGAVPAASDPSSSSVFAAVQSLGLKLEPRKVPVETLIIDHVEKLPTDN
jgi:uncharacterized protein (TIGR03435 family)